MRTITKGKYTYTVTDSVPSGYEVWNIGTENAPEGCVPLAQPITYDRHNPKRFWINAETLVAVPASDDDRNAIMELAAYASTPKDARRYLNRLQKKSGKLSEYRRNIIEKGLPALERLFSV